MLHSFHVAIFSYCTIFMLHFLCYNLFMLHFFCVEIFLRIALFHLFSYSFISFHLLHFYTLQCFRFAFFSCCIFRILQLFMLHYFQICSQNHHKHLRWRAFQQQLAKLLNTVKKLSILDVRGVLITLLLFPCCTFSMLQFFHIEKYWKWMKDRKHNQKNDITFSTVNLFHLFLSLHSFEWLIKWKGTSLPFVVKEYVCQGLKLLRLGWELKLISPWHKTPTISCRNFKYNIGNE